MPYQDEIKAIKLLQDRNIAILKSHATIDNEIENIKHQLNSIENGGVQEAPEYCALKQETVSLIQNQSAIQHIDISQIVIEANEKYSENLLLSDILTFEDFADAEQKIQKSILIFNKKYALDGWDYAIAGWCGIFAGMIDLFCVQAPPKPTVKWTKQVDGICNKWVQKVFNNFI